MVIKPLLHSDSLKRRSVQFVLSILLFAFGVLFGRLLGIEHSPNSVGANGKEDELTRQMLERVSDDVRRLHNVMEEFSRDLIPSAEPLSARVPVDTDKALQDQIDKLVLAIQDLKALGTRSQTANPNPGRRSIAEIEQDVGAQTSSDMAKLNAELSNAHLLWTIDELLARYGTPSRIQTVGANPGLVYNLNGNPETWIRFETLAGRVTYADVYVRK